MEYRRDQWKARFIYTSTFGRCTAVIEINSDSDPIILTNQGPFDLKLWYNLPNQDV